MDVQFRLKAEDLLARAVVGRWRRRSDVSAGPRTQMMGNKLLSRKSGVIGLITLRRLYSFLLFFVQLFSASRWKLPSIGHITRSLETNWSFLGIPSINASLEILKEARKKKQNYYINILVQVWEESGVSRRGGRKKTGAKRGKFEREERRGGVWFRKWENIETQDTYPV